ncbi:alpha/beta hydrolase [Isoptericola sp. b490]|uniref:alpha/beta fold hydrolase n=1 Tax=Actinotalea lenta TaxID=3064654 RepID=UPI0027133E4C|nr:alpha/beta hydrolase [Isoptericola sp. b490]MDO8121453.1 alpha/beta hydrolase [Isoptericola sp. b490]
MTTTQETTMQMLSRPDGRIAFTDAGSGPLLVLVPGMGDTAGTWRDVVPSLVDAGFRVVTCDLRGHGASDTGFAEHGDDATGADVLALVEHLDAGPAVLVGNSMGGSAVAWAAAQRPDLVAGLVLVSPFLDEAPGSTAVKAATRLAFRALFAGPWGPWAWARYYAGPLTRGRHAAWQTEHVATLEADLRRPGRLREFRRLVTQLDHSLVGAVVDRVQAPAVVLVGANDPDYRDPAAELAAMGERLRARTVLVPDAAHYPQHQAPEVFLEATSALLATLPRDGERWVVAGA